MSWHPMKTEICLSVVLTPDYRFQSASWITGVIQRFTRVVSTNKQISKFWSLATLRAKQENI